MFDTPYDNFQWWQLECVAPLPRYHPQKTNVCEITRVGRQLVASRVTIEKPSETFRKDTLEFLCARGPRHSRMDPRATQTNTEETESAQPRQRGPQWTASQPLLWSPGVSDQMARKTLGTRRGGCRLCNLPASLFERRDRVRPLGQRLAKHVYSQVVTDQQPRWDTEDCKHARVSRAFVQSLKLP